PRVAHHDARFLAPCLERERETERRAESVAVRIAVAREEEPLPRREELRDVFVGGVERRIARRHEASDSSGGFGIERSSSSTRAPCSSVWSSAKWRSGACRSPQFFPTSERRRPRAWFRASTVFLN